MNFVDKLLNNKLQPAIVGLLQAVAVALYCAGVGAFMYYIERTSTGPGYLGVFLFLVLFVFSAAVTGSLVFGFPVYLALKNKIKEALLILAYTLLYSLLIILVTIAAVVLIG